MAMPAQQINGPSPHEGKSKTRVPFFVPVFNPIARRLLGVGVPMGPNALLTVRGRTSGLPRSTPVAVLEIDGRRWIIGTFGDVNWVRNLRAAGEATLTVKGRPEPVEAVALSPQEAAIFFNDVLAPYARRSPLIRFVLSRVLGASELLSDPDGSAQRKTVFELRPRASGGSRPGTPRPA
jgi:deazaflavin-dependent oxidoreductase (nitroreductase family)